MSYTKPHSYSFILNTNRQYILYLGFLCLLSPIYSTPSIGGTGFSLSFNISAWLIATWFIVIGLFLLSKNKHLSIPRNLPYLLFFPCIIIISGLLTEINQPISWLFRVLYIFGGLFFLISLFQFSIAVATLDRLLFIFIIAMGLHAVIGAIQINAPDLLPNWVPKQRDFVPRSFFQQINAHASFLATGVITSLYYISRPNFKFNSLFFKLIIIISFSLAIYIITASGSRIGFLSLLIGVPLILWARYKLLRKQKKLLGVLFISSLLSVTAGQAGLIQTVDKVARLKMEGYSDARWSIYSISTELIKNKPLTGHGIGNFLKAWNPQAANFYLNHPNASLPLFIGHPHNEIFFWMIELGLVALVGILGVILGISKALYYCGFQRGGAYAAMLLPISLHTQVEHPFYVSSIHWFLWLFLLFILFKHQTKRYILNLSSSAFHLMQSTTIIIAIIGTWFFINTAQAQVELKLFLSSNKVEHNAPLYLALNNLYFRPIAEQYAMRKTLYLSIYTKNRPQIEAYEKWAKLKIKNKPDFNIYDTLVLTSNFLRPEGNGCDALSAGLLQYPQYEPFQKAHLNCR